MNAIFKRPFRIQVDEPKQKFKLFNKSSFPVPLPDHVAKNWFFQHQVDEGHIVIVANSAPKEKVDFKAKAKADAEAKAKADAEAKAKADAEAKAKADAEAAAKAAEDAELAELEAAEEAEMAKAEKAAKKSK